VSDGQAVGERADVALDELHEAARAAPPLLTWSSGATSLVLRRSGTTLSFVFATSILGPTMGSSISVVRACVSLLNGATSSRVVALVRWPSNTRSFLDGDEGSGCFPYGSPRSNVPSSICLYLIL
jgi:hypothetical protein